MPIPGIEGYEFGPYRIETGERLLHRGEELVPLPPKVAETLLVLVQNAGRMVDKNDLLKAVWPDTFVEEGALTRNISLLRKTLGDAGDNPTFIETIPKRGYRFVAPVQSVAPGPIRPRAAEFDHISTAQQTNGNAAHPSAGPARAKRTKWVLAAAFLLAVIGGVAMITRRDPVTRWSVPPIPSGAALAVLPFRSIDKDPSQGHFADGMTQAVISSLANLRKLRVVSLVSENGGRTDAAWTAILQDRSVQRVLAGTVLRSGDRVRIDAQLLDPATRAVHWAKSYQREGQDVLALESDVAEAIAEEIQVNITSREKERLRQMAPAKPEALDAYLQGRYFWNRRTEDGLRRAMQYFKQAIATDPRYAAAYSGLADAYSVLGSIGTDSMPPNEAMPLARAAAEKAIELDPDLGDAHVSLAYVKLSYDWDLSAAAREFARGLALNPNSATGRHWYSHYFMAAGDLRSAADQMHEALMLEPLSPSINIGIGWCLYYSRQYEQAIERFRTVTEMDPSVPLAHQTLGMAYQQNKQLDLAIEEFKRAAAFSNNNAASVASLASAYASAGRLADARLELARLEEMSRVRYVPAFYFASVHYAMRDLAKTFEWGWKAVGERCDYLIYLRVEPRVGKLAAHPEFLRAMAALHRK
jgi:DNA-binding winged helix-turn-helix (wHTH) protein/TolB-like protein/Tfp pilus assembly protein PilF